MTSAIGSSFGVVLLQRLIVRSNFRYGCKFTQRCKPTGRAGVGLRRCIDTLRAHTILSQMHDYFVFTMLLLLCCAGGVGRWFTFYLPLDGLLCLATCLLFGRTLHKMHSDGIRNMRSFGLSGGKGTRRDVISASGKIGISGIVFWLNFISCDLIAASFFSCCIRRAFILAAEIGSNGPASDEVARVSREVESSPVMYDVRSKFAASSSSSSRSSASASWLAAFPAGNVMAAFNGLRSQTNDSKSSKLRLVERRTPFAVCTGVLLPPDGDCGIENDCRWLAVLHTGGVVMMTMIDD
uniref:Uncharacterized protein n=1 Tax=Anopheles farauti TaxID=69004 RepID=A0A182Q6R6_9DIPT